jgi:hypothetical protein
MTTANKIQLELTDEQIANASFRIVGRLGYEIIRTKIGSLQYADEATFLVRGNQALYQAEGLYQFRVGEPVENPLVDFLKEVFLQEYWTVSENRKWVKDVRTGAYANTNKPKVNIRANWSELLRDCNNIGYTVNALRPMHERHEERGCHRWLVPCDLYDSVVGPGMINGLTVSQVRQVQPVAVPVADMLSLEPDVAGNLLSQAKLEDVDALMACLRIEQTFVFMIDREDAIYGYKCTNTLGPFDNPLVVELNDNTVCVPLGRKFSVRTTRNEPNKGKRNDH